jgi:hypothetical protein
MKTITKPIVTLLLVAFFTITSNAQLSLYDPFTHVIMKLEYSYGALNGHTNMFHSITDAVDLKYKSQPHKAVVGYSIVDEDIYIPYFDFWFGAYFRNNQEKLKFSGGDKLEEESEFYEYKPNWGSVWMEWNLMLYFLHLQTGNIVFSPGIGFYSALPTYDFEVPLENFNDVEGNNQTFVDEDAYNFSLFPDLYGYSFAFYLALNDKLAIETLYGRTPWGPFLG